MRNAIIPHTQKYVNKSAARALLQSIKAASQKAASSITFVQFIPFQAPQNRISRHPKIPQGSFQIPLQASRKKAKYKKARLHKGGVGVPSIKQVHHFLFDKH